MRLRVAGDAHELMKVVSYALVLNFLFVITKLMFVAGGWAVSPIARTGNTAGYSSPQFSSWLSSLGVNMQYQKVLDTFKTKGTKSNGLFGFFQGGVSSQ